MSKIYIPFKKPEKGVNRVTVLLKLWMVLFFILTVIILFLQYLIETSPR